ncbi:MAG TPA: FixH family protein [bacterium]|jgi:nitrogen fixation protein FixH
MTPRSFRIRFWPTGLLMSFTAFIAVDVAFVTTAFRHQPQMVSEHYYADGFNLRQIAERKAATDATGWAVHARCLPATESESPLVELNVTGRDGLPCDSLAGTASFYRPSDKSLDIQPLPLRFMGTGRYFVVLPHPLAHGGWQVVAHLARGSQQSDMRLNLFAEN